MGDSYQSTLTTMAQAMHAVIKYSDKHDISLVDVMGYTTHAFRIRIDSEKADTGGPVAHVWEPFYISGLQNLGFLSVCYDPIIFPVPLEHVAHALTLIQNSIDRGLPAISFALNSPEFNVIFGYDDDKRELHVKDHNGVAFVPYEKLGQGKILVISIQETLQFDRLSALKNALGMVLFHAMQPEPGLHTYQNGLAAYDAWIQAFRNGTIDDIGNAYNIAFVGDARKFAVKFLKDIVDKWPADHPSINRLLHGNVPYKSFICQFAEEAAGHYLDVVKIFESLQSMFPFPDGGNARDSVNVLNAIRLLEQAKQAEQKAIHVLGRMYYWL